MSKEIYLYSEDKKYKCGVELADSTDHFNCPEHSIMVLFEERDNGTYVIAEARDKLLETEKDKELKIYKRALKIACDKLRYTDAFMDWLDYEKGCIKQAREEIKKEKKDE